MAQTIAAGNGYADHPDHPLRDAADWNDVDSEQADAIADAVVIRLLPWLDTSR